MWRALVVLVGCEFHTVAASSDGGADGPSDATTAPIAIDTTAFAKGMGVTSLTWMHAASGSDRALVVGVSWGMPDSAIVSVTYAGKLLTPLGSEINPTKMIDVAMFALGAPPVGSNAAVVTFAAMTGEAVAGSVSFTGVDQGTPTRNFTSAHGPDNPLPSIAVTSAATDLVMDTIVVDTNALSISTTPGQTQAWNVGESEWAGASTRLGAPTATMAWHENDGGNIGNLDDWALCAVSVHGR